MSRVDLTDVTWIKSSRSEGNGQCLEVAHVGDNMVALRDSKNHSAGPVVIYNGRQWQAFIGGTIDGLFERT